ncbi:MAG: YncE family protein [Terracidiphilus sp.]|jgi:YVTN family beta-propeller protein
MPIQRTLRLLTLSFASAALLCALLAAPTQLTAQHPYKILDRWKIGGDGGWDCLLADPATHRLYLTRGARVDVLDTQTGKPVGTIAGLHGTHGIALDNAGKFGYISDGGGNAVVVFDRTTLATVATIPAGQNPDGIVFEPATQTVWAFNGRSKDVSVISAATRKVGVPGDGSSSLGCKVVATIPLPGKPEFPAVDGKGTVFDNIEDKSELVRLDAHTNKLTAEWPLTGCDGPSGLDFDIPGARFFSVCDNKHMAVTDANTGKSLATPDIGDGPDAAAYDATHKLAFSSNGASGTLTVIDAASVGYPVIENLPTQRGARTMAYDSATGRIYLVTAEFGPRPDPTPDNPHPRPTILPGTFTVLVVGR